MGKSLYMHTLDREPAFFDGYGPDGQIVFARHPDAVHRLESSLASIRENIKRTARFRKAAGLDFSEDRYGYVRIPKSAIEKALRA